MIRYLLSCCLLVCLYMLPAQDTLSTNPNNYTAIVDLDLCENTITVNDTTGLSVGTQLLLIQMQGATINESNSSAFGTISNIGQAGHYEWNHITARQGNVLTLGRSILWNYEPGAGLQAVGFQIYETLYVQDTLRAKAWDGNTGGLIVLMAQDSIILEAPVLADGAGFRGGATELATDINCTVLTFNNNYFYASGNWRGAPKGEGVAAIISGKENGRGAQANGGGGGNNHNSGGGGGSSTVSGGVGGENNEPSFGGCDGFFPGSPGRDLAQDTSRLFLGGGGGAGHRNNENNTSGGNGGGIVLIKTATLRFAGGHISANGLPGSSTLGDGAGGGGAGGSIVLEVDGSLATVALEAQGGDGGNVNNSNANRCFGPGGGGSGGVVYTSSAGWSTLLSPGSAGLSINSNSCSEGTNGASAGMQGLYEIMSVIPQGEAASVFSILASPSDTFSCPGASLALSVVVSGPADFQWQVFNDNAWVNLSNNALYSGVNTPTLSISNENDSQRYRLAATTPCTGETVYSEVTEIDFLPHPIPAFTSTLDNLNLSLSNNSSDADTYLWEFGDGATSTLFEPTHQYDSPGEYLLCLSVSNACGTFKETSLIQIAGLQAQLNVEPNMGCAPLSVQFDDLSQGDITQRLWSFPGGTPAQSSAPNPVVVYNDAGMYDVQLVVSDGTNSDTIFLQNHIQITDVPTSGFGVVVNGNQVTFTAQTTTTDAYDWVFGDSSSDTGQSVQHTYANDGMYTIQLTVSNDCGTDVSTQNVQIGEPTVAAIGASRVVGCAPLLVDFTDQSTGDYNGRQWDFPGGDPISSTLANPTVIYDSPGTYTASLHITDNMGNLLTTELTIEVQTAPNSAYTYEVDGLSVAFQNLSSNAQGYSWVFGDGQESTAEHPNHTYASAGVYEVTLNAQGEYCSLATTQTVVVGSVNTTDLGAAGIRVYPNPATDGLWVEGLDGGRATLYNALGQKVASWSILTDRVRLDWQDMASGAYYLHLSRNLDHWVSPLVIK